jgi:hypothetical protein
LGQHQQAGRLRDEAFKSMTARPKIKLQNFCGHYDDKIFATRKIAALLPRDAMRA